jgi:hypothetical protein
MFAIIHAALVTLTMAGPNFVLKEALERDVVPEGLFAPG